MTLGSFTIRPAHREDIDSLVSMWLALNREQEAMDDRYVLAEDAAKRWRNDLPEWISHELHRILIAVFDDSIAGFIHAYRWNDPPIYKPVPAIFIDDLYVASNYRGMGLGSKMLEAVKQWGIEEGVKRFRLRVLAKNREAIRFWEKNGGDAMVVTYTLWEPTAPIKSFTSSQRN